MAEVRRIPQWVMLEALRNDVDNLSLESSVGGLTGSIAVGPTSFYIDTADADPVLKLSTTETLQVDVGDTIMAIILFIEGTDAPTVYDGDDHYIRYPIGGTDGEYFPDGGSIDVTEFAVNLDDL